MSKPKSNDPKPYGLNDKLKFGENKGSTIAEMYKSNPNYIHWCIENLSWFVLTDEAFEALPDKTNNRRSRGSDEEDDAYRGLWPSNFEF